MQGEGEGGRVLQGCGQHPPGFGGGLTGQQWACVGLLGAAADAPGTLPNLPFNPSPSICLLCS